MLPHNVTQQEQVDGGGAGGISGSAVGVGGGRGDGGNNSNYHYDNNHLSYSNGGGGGGGGAPLTGPAAAPVGHGSSALGVQVAPMQPMNMDANQSLQPPIPNNNNNNITNNGPIYQQHPLQLQTALLPPLGHTTNQFYAARGAGANHALPPQQQSQPILQPQPHTPLTTNTPWMLGSTDGTYAMRLALYQQQQEQHGRFAAAETIRHHQHQQRQQQQQQQQYLHQHPNAMMHLDQNGRPASASPTIQSQPLYHHPNNTANHSSTSTGTVSSNNSSGGSPGVAIAINSGKASPSHSVSSSIAGAAVISAAAAAFTSGASVNVSVAASSNSGYSNESSIEMGYVAPPQMSMAANNNNNKNKNNNNYNPASSQQQQQQQQPISNIQLIIASLAQKQSLYQDRLFRQPSASVECVLAAACEVMGFDIAEMWLRTGPKTHQLTNSHLRPTALEDSVRRDLVDVYYGEKSSERTHRLSPALCKRAKEANDVVWVTANNTQGAEALRCSISNVRTAVAIPVCHEASNTNITIIFFSIRRILVRPTSVEFLVHMALSAGVGSVNSLAEAGLIDRDHKSGSSNIINNMSSCSSQSEHFPSSSSSAAAAAALAMQNQLFNNNNMGGGGGGGGDGIRYSTRSEQVLVSGAQLDMQWRQLHNVEYLTDGGNSWIHTAVFEGKPVVVKTLKPECQDVAMAINEIEGELAVHSRLHHPNIVNLLGAGTTSKGVRFIVMERLDGGTLTQMLGYDTRIRDRRRRFWRKKLFSFVDLLRIARSIAHALAYCHEECIPGCMVLHRDLKPDNIGFTLDGTVKILDFGLARIIENASADSEEVYAMSGETGSLRYMAPEVADALPYNAKADVYSFGIILWELNATKKPFDGLNREMFYERVVHGGERPSLHRKWPKELTSLMTECWDAEMANRPKFRQIVERLDAMLSKEKGGPSTKSGKNILPKLSGLYNRHSTWF